MSSTFPKHIRIVNEFQNTISPVYRAADGRTFYGLQDELLFLFSRFLNFTYTIVVPVDKSMGILLNDGNLTGAAGMLQRGEADMAFIMHQMSVDALDYAYPLQYSRITFMTQEPTPIPKSFILFQPFSGEIWTIFFLSTLGFFVLFCAMNRTGRGCVRIFFSTLGNILGQPFSVPLIIKSQVILFIGWILALFFLIHSFKSVFLSFLLLVPTKGVKTIDELSSAIADGTVVCRTFPNSMWKKRLAESSDESYRIICKSVNENSHDMNNLDSYFDPYNAKRTCFISRDRDLLLFKGMMISKDSFFHELHAFPMRKEFRGKKVLDKTIRRMIETGLLTKMENDYYFFLFILHQSNTYLTPQKVVTSEKTLALQDLKGAFLILEIGLSLAFLVFLIEILFFHLARKSRLRH